jgi:hypothetical protein
VLSYHYHHQCIFEFHNSEESGSDELDSDDGQRDGDSDDGDVVPYEKSMAEGSVHPASDDGQRDGDRDDGDVAPYEKSMAEVSVPPAGDDTESNASKQVDVQEGDGVEAGKMEGRNHHRSLPGKNLLGQYGQLIKKLRTGEQEQQDDVGEGGGVEDPDDVDHPATHMVVEIHKVVKPNVQNVKRKAVVDKEEEKRSRLYRTRAKKRESMDAKKWVL